MFSIIIPAYNEEKYIGRCLKSILSQEWLPECEIIVVDNKSSDKTAEIVRKNFSQVKLVFEPKKRVAIARNRGAKEARGEILIFIDADVIAPKDHFKKILAEFKKDQRLIALSGPYFFSDGSLYTRFITFLFYQVLVYPAEYFFNRLLNFGSGSIGGNFAVYKSFFEKVRGFNEGYPFYGDDTDLPLRLRKFGKVRFFSDLKVESSARRLEKEGALRTCLRYAINVVWPHFFGRPFTKDYIDVR